MTHGNVLYIRRAWLFWTIGRLLATMADWHERARQRRRLFALDGRALKDIGLSRADVCLEVSKPFWRP